MGWNKPWKKWWFRWIVWSCLVIPAAPTRMNDCYRSVLFFKVPAGYSVVSRAPLSARPFFPRFIQRKRFIGCDCLAATFDEIFLIIFFFFFFRIKNCLVCSLLTCLFLLSAMYFLNFSGDYNIDGGFPAAMSGLLSAFKAKNTEILCHTLIQLPLILLCLFMSASVLFFSFLSVLYTTTHYPELFSQLFLSTATTTLQQLTLFICIE